MTRETVTIELSDNPKVARDIAAGGVFVPGCKLQINAECALVVRGPTEEIELPARVVYVDPKTGAGLELVNFTPALRDHLTRLLGHWTLRADSPAIVDTEGETLDMPADDAKLVAARTASVDLPLLSRTTTVPVTPSTGLAVVTEVPQEVEEPPPEDEPPEETDPVKRKHAMNIAERLRGLTLAQQIKHATSVDPQERIMLERFYGKNVWEALLRNPRLTPPEVSRIARMGTAPKTLLEIIVNNGAWLQIPEVRRALLGNPRLSTDQIIRVLRMLPKPELKLASTMTVYPYAVRDAAKRLLREQGG